MRKDHALPIASTTHAAALAEPERYAGFDEFMKFKYPDPLEKTLNKRSKDAKSEKSSKGDPKWTIRDARIVTQEAARPPLQAIPQDAASGMLASFAPLPNLSDAEKFSGKADVMPRQDAASGRNVVQKTLETQHPQSGTAHEAAAAQAESKEASPAAVPEALSIVHVSPQGEVSREDVREIVVKFSRPVSSLGKLQSQPPLVLRPARDGARAVDVARHLCIQAR